MTTDDEVKENSSDILDSDNEGAEISDMPSIVFRRVNVTKVEPVSFLTLKINVENSEIESLLDTGARVSLMKKSVANHLNLEIDASKKSIIYGIGGKDHKVVTSGVVETDIKMSTLRFKCVKFHIVPDTCMDHWVFLGMDFLQKNGLVVNFCRKRIKYCDKKTGAQWELYITSEGYKLVCSNFLVQASAKVICDSNLDSSVRVPVNIVYPKPITSLDDEPNDLYLYEGGIGRKSDNCLYGVTGIMDLKNPFVLMRPSEFGHRVIDVGEEVGTISTVICIEDSESAQVQVTNQEEMIEDVLEDKVELGQQLTMEQRKEVYDLLNEHRNVISQGDDDVGKIDVGTLEIKLYDYTPIYHRPRRFPEPVANEIDQECAKLLAQDIIEPSLSPYNCRVLPIRKGDGTLRLCMDYRDLNAKTVPDRFPMTNLVDSIFSLHGFQYFTTIDLVRGYYQMEVKEDSREFTAFSTSRGHWQYKRMPFGLKNAPAAFQRAMQDILKQFPRSRVIIYLDDILIIEKDFLRHKELVKQVLNTLYEHGVKIKLGKCSWFKDTVEFLGHEVSGTGIKKHPSYIKKVQEFPRPMTVKQLQEFMGLVNWQRKFVPHCSDIGQSLYTLTGGNPRAKINWTQDMMAAFQHLKDILTSEMELAFPDYSEGATPLQLFVDASATGAGACLCQQQGDIVRVILYDSHSFNDTQKRYSTIERELAAIRWGVKACRPFLFGQHFKLHTDHQPLVYLNNMKLIDHRLARTLEDLAEYNFEIVYTPGQHNQAADMLSRLIIQTPSEGTTPEVNTIPVGLRVVNFVPGGGDSMFISLISAYEEFLQNTSHQDREPNATSPSALRKELFNDLISNPQKFNLPTDAKFKKLLRSMLQPGVLPIPEALLAFSDRYRVTVCVHYGFERPVIYKGLNASNDMRVHLQCLAGIHFNPMAEYKSYKSHFIQSWYSSSSNVYSMFNSKVSPSRQNVNVILINDDIEEDFSDATNTSLCCGHEYDGATAKFTIEKSQCCALLDTGALMNLMTIDVYNKLNGDSMEKSEISLLRGIGDTSTSVYGTVVLSLTCKELQIPIVSLKFLVVPSNVLDTCVLLGVPCLMNLDVDLDFQNMKVHYQDRNVDMGLAIYPESHPIQEDSMQEITNFYVVDNQIPGITHDRIMEDQDLCPKLKKLKQLVAQEVLVNDVPKRFQVYKRSWSQLLVKDSLLVKEIHDKYIPVVSFNLLISIVLNIHVKNSHIGSFKMLKMLEELIWQPSMRSVIRDACATCSICQRSKTISRVKVPPTIKIQTKEPFELVALDLVSLPTTSDGYIGILVLVDHFTKWLAIAPIKNKKTNTIIEKLEHQLFPGLVKLPTKILTDNGPEFNSLEFSNMAERLNILHLKTTAYKPSSNGAVERVNRTIIEFLRNLTERPIDWKEHLPVAVRTYNNTTHNETKLSPARFIMTKEHVHGDVPIVSVEQKKLWEEGHPQYTAYQPGQSVLRRIFRTGRLNVDKMKPKYEGPFSVVSINENNVTYILKDPVTERTFKAHHIQLKPWRNPPRYIVQHLKRFPIDMKILSGEEICDNFKLDYNPFIPYADKGPQSSLIDNGGRSVSPEFSFKSSKTTHLTNSNISKMVGNNNYSDYSVPYIPMTDTSAIRFPNKCLNDFKPPLPPIVEDTEVVSSELSSKENYNSSSSSSSRSLDMYILDKQDWRGDNISETGAIEGKNCLDWSVSTIDAFETSSITSVEESLNGLQISECDMIISLVEKLEKLCISDVDTDCQEVPYKALTIVPMSTLNTDNSIDDSIWINNPKPLSKSQSLPSLIDFSGFSRLEENTKTATGQLTDRLREISRGLSDIKETVLKHRRNSLTRVQETLEFSKTRMETVKKKVSDKDLIRSPPFLRSRGKAVEVEFIPKRPAEYKKQKK